MNTGDKVTCRATNGYCFTTGKVYTVLEFQDSVRDDWYTWPAYVRVKDDFGDEVWCHALRFNEYNQ